MTPEESARAPLDGEARGRLDALAREIGGDPRRIAVVFPAAARRVARGPGPSGDPDGIAGPTLDDLVRGELLVALRDAVPPGRLADEVDALYRFGDADEKRAVLRALPHLGDGVRAVPLLADALRSNDPRLIAAAVGTPAAARLDAAAWRQAILKCLFTEVPLSGVWGLRERADTDAELARMVADFAAERAAAGRIVPADTTPLLAAHPGPRAAVERLGRATAARPKDGPLPAAPASRPLGAPGDGGPSTQDPDAAESTAGPPSTARPSGRAADPPPGRADTATGPLTAAEHSGPDDPLKEA
ncbi:EboA domain-containing protein [Nocardiopsis sediminis]|uniref:EboA domain-containing protein n=1 Tax=Nocardiopsis sediminis TaxID=1778267 RepID=A0ABV8FII0_9ACTN